MRDFDDDKYLIGEVKTKSPFGYRSDKDFEEQFQLATRVSDLVSIHVTEEFGGSLKQLRWAREYTELPILAKGYHSTDEKIKESLEILNETEDLVLCVGRCPKRDLIRYSLIEPLNLQQLKMIPADIKFAALWNRRDLSDGSKKTESFEEARKLYDGTLIQASCIESEDDMHPDADGYLVGTHLEEVAKDLGRL